MKSLKVFIVIITLALQTACTFDFQLSKNERTSSSSDNLTISAPTSYANISNNTSLPLNGTCGADVSTIEVLINSTLVASAPCVSKTWSTQLDLSSYEDGAISISIREPNSSESIPPISLTKDSIPPDVSGLTLTDGNFYNSLSQSPSLSWNDATDAISGIERYELAIGTSSGGTQILTWTPVGAVTSYQKTSLSLTEGVRYYPSLRAVDSAGNVSSVVSGDGWVPDVSAPNLPASFNDMNFGSITESPLMSWAASTDALSGLAEYQLALGSSPGATDLQNWQNISPAAIQNKLTGLSLINGQIYYPSLRAVDNVGNTSSIKADNGFRAVEKWKNQEPSLSAYLGGGVTASALQSDGKRMLAGSFTSVGGSPLMRAGRLNNDGSVDTSFNMGTGFNGAVSALAVQGDGKVIVGGSFTTYNGTSQNYITRLNSDGSRDTNFNIGTGFNNSVSAMSLQSDGKILVAGSFSSYDGASQIGIARLNTDGTRDTSFNTGTGFVGNIYALSVQNDGKILVGGFLFSYNGTSQTHITRLNSDGSLDTSLSLGSGFDNSISAISVQSDGKILVGGNFTSYNGTTQNRITRLNNDGSRDTSFIIGIGINNNVYAINVQSDGKILVGGNFHSYNGALKRGVARLNSNGSLDTSFTLGIEFTNGVYDLSLQDDGKILVGGSLNPGDGNPFQYLLSRFNRDGTVDNSLSLGTGLNSLISAISIQSDGKILLGGGFTAYNSTTQSRVIRIDSDGTLDSSLNIGTGFNMTVNSISMQGDGKILVGGNFTSYKGTSQNRITRLNSDGSRDSGFNIGTGFNQPPNTISMQSDGKILVGGNFTSYNGTSQNYIARLNSDGSLDTSFAIGTGFNLTVNRISVQSDGKILVGGNFTSYNGTSQNRIARLNSDGSLDTSLSLGSGFDNSISAISVQSDGKILVGGNFTSYNGTSQNRITRLNSDGSLDTSFNVGTGFNSWIKVISMQSDGKVLVGGNFTSYNGTSQNRIARLNSDGSLDTSFNVGAGFSNQVNTLSIQSDGKIIVGGDFTDYDNLVTGGAVLLGW